jgi:hypothetical protein
MFGLFILTAVSAPAVAQISPATFAGLELSSAPLTVRDVGQPGPAPIVEIATTSSAMNSDAVFRRTSTRAAWALLGLAFSVLTAFNILVLSHLRRVYAPRRGSKVQMHDYPRHPSCNAIELPQSHL